MYFFMVFNQLRRERDIPSGQNSLLIFPEVQFICFCLNHSLQFQTRKLTNPIKMFNSFHPKFYHMELPIFRHSEFQKLYNCSRVKIDQIPLEQRQHPLEGYALILLSAIYYFLYIPCLYGIWKHATWANPCYAILLFISICDLAILWIIGPLHGYFALNGVVFCSHPMFIYVAGVLACEVLWTMESTADLILALNRCIDVLSPKYSEILFSGRRILIWLAIPSIYGLRNLMFSMPAVYSNSIWFFNPYIGYIEDTEGVYVNFLHTAHNIFIAVANPIIYVIFLAIMLLKIRSFGDGGHSAWSMMNSVFLQVFAISALNTVASSIYIYMQYVSAPEALMLIAHFSWIHIHGFPPVIYLLLNPTIRMESKIFCKKIFGENSIISIATNSANNNRVSAAITAHANANNLN